MRVTCPAAPNRVGARQRDRRQAADVERSGCPGEAARSEENRADLSLLLAGSRFCRCCGFGGACGLCRRCGRLCTRRSGGGIRSSSSIGLLFGLLLFLFTRRRFRDAHLGETQRTSPGLPSFLGHQLDDPLVALQHVARTGEATPASKAFVDRHVTTPCSTWRFCFLHRFLNGTM